MPPRKAVVPKSKASPVLDRERFEETFKGYKPTEHVEVSPPGWVLPNRVKFGQWIYSNFKYPDSLPNEKLLFPSQRFVKDFMQYDSPYRGLLLYHSLGTGKSQASIVAAENLIGKMDVVVVLPASLQRNFIEEIKKGTSFFSLKQNWKFVPLLKFADVLVHACKVLFLKESYAKKQKGIWVPMKQGASNWDGLSDSDRQAINAQLDAMIAKKYTFVNYNGLNSNKLNNFSKSGNFFDDKVVIIDEVHGFMSTVVGNAKANFCRKLYHMLLLAKNTRFVLLSGTPIINAPYEIAFTVNLLKGPQDLHEVKWTPAKLDMDALEAYLDQHEYVDNYEVDVSTERVVLQLAPDGFFFSNKKEYMLKRVEGETRTPTEEILRSISKHIGAGGAKHKSTMNFIFPIKASKTLMSDVPKGAEDQIKEYFTDSFVDMDNAGIKNERLLARRMSGCVSYFGTYSKDYPTQLPTKDVVVDMTDYQFGVYQDKRESELKQEQYAKRKNRKKAGDLFATTSQVYRTFTRATCNYVFPEEVERPLKKEKTLMTFYKALVVPGEDEQEQQEILEEMRDIDDVAQEKNARDADDDDVVPEALEKYEKRIQKALQKISKNGDVYLSVEALASKYSPKYAAIIRELNDKAFVGKALVYSQFRNVEGLGVLSLALKANGWAEFKIRKDDKGEWQTDIKPEDMSKPLYFMYDSTNEEQTNLLVKVFNNEVPDNIKVAFGAKNNLRGDILRLIMITQSGAEGISLKHVRQVHILEPYWNEIRISQVIGRAVRARSHSDLPEKERNVQVFRYVVTLGKEQKKRNKTLANKDGSLTTDEYIRNIALRKANIINKVQDVMKSTAVDCLVHAKQHAYKTQCLAFPENMDPNALVYKMDMDADEKDAEYKQKVVKKLVKETSCKKCTISGMSYAYNPAKKVLYDYEAYKDGRLVVIGRLVEDAPTGKWKLVTT
jgi:Helicase conserved C-terminal domain